MEQIEVTTTQNEYLKELATGPKTTHDLVLSKMVCANSVSKIIKRLRDAGLVSSSRRDGIHGNAKVHELITPYQELDLVVKNHHYNQGIPVSEEEVLYAAKLRNDGLTGRRLTAQHQKRYPYRRHHIILNSVVAKARKRGLCR